MTEKDNRKELKKRNNALLYHSFVNNSRAIHPHNNCIGKSDLVVRFIN